jgi:Cu-Zn family superoxide dismutase
MKKIVLALAAATAACTPKTQVGSPSSPAPAPSSPAQLPASMTVQATATINDGTNTRVGTASFSDTPSGLLVSGSVAGLGLGSHGVHLHTIGSCQGPTFASAGGHFNPTGKKHGFKNPEGHHAGDMPNIVSPAAGQHNFQFVVEGVKLTGNGGLLDSDGAAIVIHSGEDDYMTDPAGNSGARIACGVITLSK